MDEAVDDAKTKKKNNGLFVLASARGYIGDVQQLVEMGADAGARDKRGVGALHYACGQGRLEVVKFLWSKGLDLDAEDPGGRTPLHWAVLGDQAPVVAFLVSKGAWMEASDAADDTALHLAARSGSREVARALLEGFPRGRHPSVRDRNKRGLTPLGEALALGRADMAQLLVTQGGADVADRPRGWSLLHLAAALGQEASVSFLLAKKLPVNDVGSEEGLTPLHCAALAGSAACARLLLDAKADPQLAAADGRLPYDLAPEKDAALRALLRTSAPARLSPAAAAAPARALTMSEAFAALSREEQAARVQRWAELDEGPKLSDALAGLPAETQKRVADLRTTLQVLRIQQAINELHEDEDFQGDASQPRMMGVVEDARTGNLSQHAGDGAAVHVLGKLRRFQMLISANGHHKVPFVDLIVAGKVGWKETGLNRLRGMRIMAQRQADAVIASACAEDDADAHAAAEAALLPQQPDPRPTPEERAAVDGPAAPSAGGAAGAPGGEADGAAPGTGGRGSGRRAKKRVSFKQGDGAAEVLDGAGGSRSAGATLESALEGGEAFSWAAFWQALRRQLAQTAITIVAFLVALYLSGHRFPWQAEPPAGEAGTPAAAEPAQDVYMTEL